MRFPAPELFCDPEFQYHGIVVRIFEILVYNSRGYNLNARGYDKSVYYIELEMLLVGCVIGLVQGSAAWMIYILIEGEAAVKGGFL